MDMLYIWICYICGCVVGPNIVKERIGQNKKE